MERIMEETKKRNMRESLWNGRWITSLGRMGASKMSDEESPLEVHYTHKIRPKNL